MRAGTWRLLAAIAIVFAVAAWIVWPGNPGLNVDLGPLSIHRPIELRQGLDLQGGLRVLLGADVPEGEALSRDSMAAARVIVENRVNALGVVEPVVQLQGDRYLVVELPGIRDPDRAVEALKGTGLLEFVETGSTILPQGALVRTSYREELGRDELDEGQDYYMPDTVFPTVFTGKDISSAGVDTNQVGGFEVTLTMTSEATSRFADYTRQNVGRVLAIVLDGRVLSSPRIESAIPDGQARISGDFTLEEARSLAIQLRYGALPVPLRVEETRAVGPSLGQDSVQKSIRAGIVGLSVVLLFMIVYYRVPGVLASLALITYAMINLALYKTIPVTITLPGVTGFLLSTGMAVDANILIFERMKEEVRWGRPLGSAVEAGFSRAWTSIRDSNLSALITCVVLFWFGSNFGATQVKGFAITLFLGVLISMFTAITVTHTLVRVAFHLGGDWLRERHWALGA
ncbi:MAG: protein translocase subunit SecD [Anaerolineae bacterium]|nr:protein translocase subunit SecD [Anaerolineae bacterium]